MNPSLSLPKYNVKFYSKLLSIRPAQLSALVKQILRLQRMYISTQTGQTFWADPVSIFGIELMEKGLHEPQMTQLLNILLRPGDVFIDVGGNEGYFSVLAASLVKDGIVHCFEPQSRLQPILAENIRLNAAQSIFVHPFALSDSEGEVSIFLRPSTNNGASSLFRHWKLGSTSEKISTTTLDTFFHKNPIERVRLVKVDCEGAEYLVIAGGKNTLNKQAIEFIAMEYHPSICGDEKCIQVHNFLKSAGYILTQVSGQCIYHLPGLETELQALGELKVDCNWNN